jgi:hypothetical protein
MTMPTVSGTSERGKERRSEIHEPAGDTAPLGLSMVGGRRHDEAHGKGQEQKRHQMQNLSRFGEIVKALIENGHELKAEDGLDPRQHHARLVGRMGHLFFQRFAPFLFHFFKSWRPMP